MRSLRRKRLFQEYKLGESRRYLLRQQNVRGNRHIQRTRRRTDLVGMVLPGAPSSSKLWPGPRRLFHLKICAFRTAQWNARGIRHRNRWAVMRRDCCIKNSAQGEREGRDRPRDREAFPTTSHRAGPRLDVSRGKYPRGFFKQSRIGSKRASSPLHLAYGHQCPRR